MKFYNVFLTFALPLIFLGCDSSTQSTSSNESPAETSRTAIPMSDESENGRYFLLTRISEDGVEKITYTRLGSENDVYGKMEIKCSKNLIRKVSTEDANSLDSLDLGDWYTPTPDWTDNDIVTFICS